MNLDDLQTGDIMLISNYEHGLFNIFLDMIRYGSHSDYVHIGIILKDPIYIDTKLTGLYLWESGYEGTPDSDDKKIKLGVQLTSIDTVLKNYSNANYFIRRLRNNSVFDKNKISEIYFDTLNKPYDINPRDWIYALFRQDSQPQKTDRFWCSAFIGYILTRLNILSDNTDWSILRPCDFALDGENLNYKSDNILQPCEYKLLLG